MIAVADQQLGLVFDDTVQYTRRLSSVRAQLLNTAPTPVHTADPATAFVASAAAALRAPSVRQRVLFALVDSGERGASDFEIGQRLDILRTTAGKRRLELQRIGLVEDTGTRRPTDTHVSAVVWRASEKGREVALALAEEAE